ncbi:HBL051Wp [Eremothecium sinecaudum]|uniref:HBL051Wp n=1 Tax=Eremothecium sinecaudum TaxID=45286 RepID=A0A109UWH0_9SACH|nr:HBL051Wp [Eremothecium sinecaudum]AMD18851.1 HBL051Wp [Eremothecium sinecaudum]
MYKIYALGSNGSGQLGIGHFKDVMVPHLTFESVIKPIKVACGGNHSLVLMEDGQLWATGDGRQGQFAMDDAKSLFNWIQIPGTFEDVACGWDYSVVIDTFGNVLTSGAGLNGELGLGSIKCAYQWRRVTTCLNSSRAIYSSFQNVVLRDGNKLFGWGPNRKGQLIEPKSKGFDSPRLIYEGKDITQVTMGKDFVAIIDSGKLVISGTMRDRINDIIRDISSEEIIKIAAMWSSLHIWTKREIFSYGNGNYGQMFIWERPSNMTHLNTGSEHGMMSLADGRVYCWGWGEHGNCGSSAKLLEETSPYNDKSNIISPLNCVLETDEKIIWLQGGCATSWICAKC